MKIDITNPLMHTNYESLKEILDILKEYYIDEYGEEYRDKISNNFKHSNYILLITSKELEEFIDNYPRIVIKNIINLLLSNIEKTENTYIQKLKNIINNELKILQYEQNVSLYNTVERIIMLVNEALSNITDQTTIKTLTNYISGLDMNYYKIVEEKINKDKNSLINLNKTKNNIKLALQKEFLLKHSYLLTKEEFDRIFQDGKSIEEVIVNSNTLSLYLSTFIENSIFELGELSIFDSSLENNKIFLKYRKELLDRLGIEYTEEELLDAKVCLSKLGFIFKEDNGSFRYGIEGLNLLEDTLKQYNEMYHKEIEKIDFYLTTKEEFNKKNILSEEVLNRTANSHIKRLIEENNYKLDYDVYSSLIFNALKSSCSDDYNGCEVNFTLSLGDTPLK